MGEVGPVREDKSTPVFCLVNDLKGINREALSLIIHTSHSQVRMRGRERQREERQIVVEYFLLSLLIILLFLRSLRDFLLYGFPDEKSLCLVHPLHCMHFVVLVVLSYKDPR